jgi:hypothetical protein
MQSKQKVRARSRFPAASYSRPRPRLQTETHAPEIAAMIRDFFAHLSLEPDATADLELAITLENYACGGRRQARRTTIR